MVEYKLSQEAFEQYRNCTNGNNNIDFELAEKKLNRNIKCGKLVHEDNFVEKYYYGTLAIKVIFGEITDIYVCKNSGSRYNGRLRWELNRQLQIT